MSHLSLDRLRVFVSSTIEECGPERRAAREAIRSTNHDAILFEELGARPHPPRDVYRARLEIAHIFVGIYKESYGWTAPDMSISGIEDEYRFAVERGMDRLLYVYRTRSSRESPLCDLIEEFKNSGVTVAFYADAEELRTRVRDDLTALISLRFADQVVEPADGNEAHRLLQALVPNASQRLRRRSVEDELVAVLQGTGRVVLRAPIGGGKTVFLAQLAEERNWLFVDGRGLTHLALISRIANALRVHLGNRPIALSTRNAAERDLARSWDEISELTVVVDDASEPLAVWQLSGDVGRLVLSSRVPLAVPAIQQVELQPWSGKEIAEWMALLRGQRPDPGETARLAHQSTGLPLYLRLYALGEEKAADLSLQQLEIKAIDSLTPEAKEITSYLALSSISLSLNDLQILLSIEGGPEEVAEHVRQATGLLALHRGHAMLVHEHLRETALNQLQQEEARSFFFGDRLGRHFEKTHRPLAAFNAYSQAGDQRRADMIVGPAANQALLMGGGKAAIPVLRRQSEHARDRGSITEEVHALLNLALALKQTGAVDAAVGSLNSARAIAEVQHDPDLTLRLRETQAVLDIHDQPRPERIEELRALRAACTDKNDMFNAARTGTLLTAEYIAADEYERAEEIARNVLTEFRELGDQYGLQMARLNLASALSGIDGKETEAHAIAQEIARDVEPDEHPRARAVLCNFLNRHYRRLGDTEQATRFAREAIDIGEQLGDRRVIALNRINLGNLHRDEDDLESALTEYRIADGVAAGAGLRDIESAANEVIASVHSQRKEYAVAIYHAQHAAAVARSVGDRVHIARAEEERAIAHRGQRDWRKATTGYQRAIEAVAQERGSGGLLVELIHDALQMCAGAERRDLKLELLRTILSAKTGGSEESIDDVDVVYKSVATMTDTTSDIGRVVPMVALAMEDLWDDVPPLVGRRIVVGITHTLLDRGSASREGLASIVAVMLLEGARLLRVEDVVDIGDKVARSIESVYFKPQPNGAGHWTVRMNVGDGVVISIVQMDESAQTAVTTAVLALLLAILDQQIGDQLLDVAKTPRREAIINVIERTALKEQIGHDVEIPDVHDGYAVMESVDLSREEQPPIVIVCGHEFPKAWRPSKRGLSDGHILFADVLLRLAGHLLAEAVERSILLPKVARIVRAIESSAATERKESE